MPPGSFRQEHAQGPGLTFTQSAQVGITAAWRRPRLLRLQSSATGQHTTVAINAGSTKARPGGGAALGRPSVTAQVADADVAWEALSRPSAPGNRPEQTPSDPRMPTVQ